MHLGCLNRVCVLVFQMVVTREVIRVVVRVNCYGYTGSNCETASSSSTACTNGANGNPCVNGGSASGTSGNCGCTCVGGYTGSNCGTAAPRTAPASAPVPALAPVPSPTVLLPTPSVTGNNDDDSDPSPVPVRTDGVGNTSTANNNSRWQMIVGGSVLLASFLLI